MFRKFIVGISIMSLGVVAAEAHGGARQHRREARARHAARALNLTDAQKSQAREIRQREREATRASRERMQTKVHQYRQLRRANDPGAEQLRAEIADLRQALRAQREPFRQQFRSVLTSSQRQQLDQWKADRKAEAEARR